MEDKKNKEFLDNTRRNLVKAIRGNFSGTSRQWTEEVVDDLKDKEVFDSLYGAEGEEVFAEATFKQLLHNCHRWWQHHRKGRGGKGIKHAFWDIMAFMSTVIPKIRKEIDGPVEDEPNGTEVEDKTYRSIDGWRR